MTRPGSPGAGLSVRRVVPVEGTVPLWHSLQSPVCFSKVRPGDPSRSLPDWAVLLSQMNSKRSLSELTCSLAVPLGSGGVEGSSVWPLASCPLGGMPNLGHATHVFLEPNPAPHDRDLYQLIIAAEIGSLRMDWTTKGMRNLH